jgi:hypothetical protein
MYPSQLRRHILAAHERLRDLLDVASELARHVRAGDTELVRPLIHVTERIEDLLLHVIDEEEDLLPPALLEADAWGEVRVERMERTHHHQRMAVQATLSEVREGRLPPYRLAQEIEEFVHELRETLRQGERVLLHPDVLRDDPITLRQMGG